MSDWLVWLAKWMTILLGSCYPAMAPEKPPEQQKEKDPAYAFYQEYRYTYDTYVYLFWDESTGAGPEEEDKDLNGAGWNHMGEWADGGKNASEGAEEAGTKNTEISADSSVLAEAFGQEEREAEMMARLQDYDYLMKNFYSVHASTTAPRNLMKAEELLGMDMKVEQDASVPQILIYHTHSQETYKDYGPDNPGASVVGIGNYLTMLLQEKGWNVIHDTSSYDLKGGKLDRSKAYNYALEGVSRILEENPTIQVVLDIHRDGVKETLHLMSEVGGKPTANIMFFQGMSRTPEGEISYLPNPYLKENLAFSLQMQMGAARHFPGYTRKIYMKGLRYNLHLRPRSALIEVGAQTNTGQEAMNAMEPLAELLDQVLKGV